MPYLKSLLCVILLLGGFGINKAYADHISSTEMYLDYIGTGPNDLRYKVTFITFRICIANNLILFPTVGINVKSANAGAGPQNNRNVTLTNEILRYDAHGDPVYEDTLDNLCPAFSKINSCRVLANVNYSGYMMRKYSDTVTLPSRQTDWQFSWYSCCRLLSYINIDYSSGRDLYLEVGLNNLFRYNNNTPRYSGKPFAFLCANQRGAILNLPSDPDAGDSLITYQIDPQQTAAKNIVYYPGFSSVSPVGATGNYAVSKASGKATFIPPLQGKYALAFRTEDYDKATGTQLSYTSRDLVITVLNCTNQPPYIDSIPQSVTGVRKVDTTGGEVTIRACLLPLSFRVNAYSNTPSGLIYMRPASALPPGMTVTPTITGGTGYMTVKWTPAFRDIGTHIVTLIAVDSTCAVGQEITLQSEFTFTIVVDSTRVLPGTFTRLPACDADQNRNLLSSSQSSGSFSWNTGQTAQAIYPGGPGYYICTAINACTIATDSFLVTADTYDSLYNVQVCDTANMKILISSPTVSPHYAWSTGDSSRQIAVTRVGDYICRTFNGCSVIHETHRVAVSVPAPPVVHDTMICQYTIEPLIYMRDTGLLWYFNSSGGTGSSSQPLINTDERGRTTLYVAIKDRNCISERTSVNITIKATPKPQASDTLIRCKGVVNYAAPIGRAPVSEIFYKWSIGSISPYIVPPTDGEYLLTSYNECGKAIDTFSVQSEDCENCVRFPDAFSPNNDGLNDAFGPLLRCDVDRFSISIYNRWGQRVYLSKDKNGRWYGTQGGVAAPGGVYMYMASMYSERSGKRIFVKGEVTLIR